MNRRTFFALLAGLLTGVRARRSVTVDFGRFGLERGWSESAERGYVAATAWPMVAGSPVLIIGVDVARKISLCTSLRTLTVGEKVMRGRDVLTLREQPAQP